jgi:hypothetical protein
VVNGKQGKRSRAFRKIAVSKDIRVYWKREPVYTTSLYISIKVAEF